MLTGTFPYTPLRPCIVKILHTFRNGGELFSKWDGTQWLSTANTVSKAKEQVTKSRTLYQNPEYYRSWQVVEYLEEEMKEHKHAAVLRAIADKGLGAAQWQDGKSLMGQWNDCTFMITPITHSFLAWRIKPEPKPDVIQYVNIYPKGVGNSYDSALEAIKASDRTCIGIIRYTIDGETGKLKSAEVLP